MSTIVISRHAGLLRWLNEKGIEFDHHWTHLDDCRQLCPGDQVIGNLPIHLAAKVCKMGGSYIHVCLNVPENLRGHELTAEQVLALNPELRVYDIQEINHSYFKS
ncbi:CRISPR-associated protein Csx16 [uncultured Photobacterium sp.]|uniref:CRISPR-associated protein Csx16 n=1 Tax=uncultured Photobacterium sp. TaxID=173973 RepID=UPI00261A8CEC|nr:CRISPR-associated protein Csx16 [uncultured Photobacterium sp.]